MCFCLTEHHQVLKEKANNLKLRPEGFKTILEDIGFVLDQSTGPVGEGGQKILYQFIRVAHCDEQDFKDLYISTEKPARDPLYSRMVTSTTPFTIFIETLPRILSAPCTGALCVCRDSPREILDCIIWQSLRDLLRGVSSEQSKRLTPCSISTPDPIRSILYDQASFRLYTTLLGPKNIRIGTMPRLRKSRCNTNHRKHSRRLPLFHIFGSYEDVRDIYTCSAKSRGRILSCSGSAHSPLWVGQFPARLQLQRVKA